MKKINKILLATMASAPVMVAHGAALERSEQSVLFLLEPGNRVEAGMIYAQPTAEGKALDILAFKRSGGAVQNYDVDTGNVAKAFNQGSVSVKFQADEHYSFGLVYEKPFAIDVAYAKDGGRYAAFGAPESVTSGMSARANADNITALAAYKFDEHYTLFGGPAVQKTHAEVVIPTSQYRLELPSNTSLGYVVGGAYEIKDIALKAAITYRSPMEYNAMGSESFVHPMAGEMTIPTHVKFKLPQSVNLDFQTGIAPKTLLISGIRWANWKKFNIDVPVYRASANEELVSYGKDAFTYNLGIGRQLTNKLSGFAMVSYDTGNGEPISPLGPPDKSYSVHLGGKYQFDDHFDIAGGVLYTIYPDQEPTSASVPVSISKFSDMSLWGAGIRVGYNW